MNISNISTGFPKFDEMIHGLEKARLIIMGGRSAMGKSAFAVSIAKNVAIDQSIPTAFFSLEMSSNHLTIRIVCNIFQLDGRKVIKGQLRKEEDIMFETGKDGLKEAPLYIDDSPGLFISEFEFKARHLVYKHNVKLILIDYLQLMITDRKFDNHKSENTMIAKCLREIAEKLDVTIIVCSQLIRRKVNGWKKPCLVNLRGYGAIDKYADVVAFIYRPEYYGLMRSRTKEQEKHGYVQIFIRKNNMGAKGSFLLRFDGSASRFYNPIKD